MASAGSRHRCVTSDERRTRFLVVAQPILIRASGKKISTIATPAKPRLLVSAEVRVRRPSATQLSGVNRTRDVWEHARGVRTALLAHSKTFLLTETVTVPLT